MDTAQSVTKTPSTLEGLPIERKLDELDTLLEQTQRLVQALVDENEVLQRDLALAIAKIEELERA